MLDARRFRVLALLYFVSGAAGLADEVAFFKYLSLAFGATAYASSAVLVAFMGGLALGAYATSRLERRITRPMLAYGTLEAVVGISCAAVPALFALVTRTYVRLAAAYDSLAAIELTRGAL